MTTFEISACIPTISAEPYPWLFGSEGACDIQDTCDAAGTCTDRGFQPAGTACGDPSNTDCSNPDTCTGTSGACSPNNEPQFTPCGTGPEGACDIQEARKSVV